MLVSRNEFWEIELLLKNCKINLSIEHKNDHLGIETNYKIENNCLNKKEKEEILQSLYGDDLIYEIYLLCNPERKTRFETWLDNTTRVEIHSTKEEFLEWIRSIEPTETEEKRKMLKATCHSQ